MRTILLVPALAALTVQPLTAQEPPERRQQLQQEVMRRFTENYRAQVGLDDEQAARFEETAQRSMEHRTTALQRERQLWMALQGQMRPGVGADEDSLRTLMAALIDIQQERVDQTREEMAAYGEFLTPVQQAQLMLSLRRLQHQIEGARMRQRGPPGGRQ